MKIVPCKIYFLDFLMYTWVNQYSIQRLFQGISEGYFTGCSGLFRGDFERFLEEKLKENRGKTIPGKIRKIQKILINSIR